MHIKKYNKKNNLILKKKILKILIYNLLFDFFINKEMGTLFNIKKKLNIKKINNFKSIRYKILNTLLKKNIYTFNNLENYYINLNKKKLK
jgi:hypothetical protein